MKSKRNRDAVAHAIVVLATSACFVLAACDGNSLNPGSGTQAQLGAGADQAGVEGEGMGETGEGPNCEELRASLDECLQAGADECQGEIEPVEECQQGVELQCEEVLAALEECSNNGGDCEEELRAVDECFQGLEICVVPQEQIGDCFEPCHWIEEQLIDECVGEPPPPPFPDECEAALEEARICFEHSQEGCTCHPIELCEDLARNAEEICSAFENHGPCDDDWGAEPPPEPPQDDEGWPDPEPPPDEEPPRPPEGP